jgi:hypothetical protein
MANEYHRHDPFDTRPTSLLECEENQDEDPDFLRLQMYDREDDEQRRFVSSLLFPEDDSVKNKDNSEESQPAKRRRSMKKNLFYKIDSDNKRIPITATQSSWYQLYVLSPNLDNQKFLKKFRLRFRLPYECYLELLDIVKEAVDEEGNLFFQCWMSCDATGLPSSPIEIMVLGALRYLGRGLTFDDIEEASCVSEENHRQFFEVFIIFGRKVLFPKWVVPPKNKVEAEMHLHEMEQAGFHGCIGSTDATHILLERVSHSQQQSHTSFKLQGTARTYNITVNHRRYILSTTSGHPCRWNDKTLQLFDSFMNDIYKGNILQDVEFELLQRKEKGEIVPVKYKGVWLTVDNGYLNQSIAIPPMKNRIDVQQIRWSQWLESMRKDVECTFGILKGRWRILKAGVRVHGVTKADNIWHTCCALHNWLLDYDGLNKKWESNELTSDWESKLGEFEDSNFVEKYSFADAIH